MKFLRPAFLCFGMSFSLAALAIPEQEFSQRFPQEVLPFFWQEGQSQYLTMRDGLKLHVRSFTKPGQDKALVILPGRTEASWKFAELVYDWQKFNYAIYIIDHRGQGASAREVPETEMQYVDNFASYRDDVHEVIEKLVLPGKYRAHYGLAHSMGANILALYAAKEQETFQKIVLSSPMLDINPAPFPSQWLAHAFTSTMVFMGFSKSFIPGHGPFHPEEKYRGTTSAVRYQAFHQLRIDRKDERVGGVSYSFAKEAMQATWDMRRDAEKLIKPVLMLQAGADEIVMTGGQDYVCQHAKQCRKVTYAGAHHELHLETDSIRGAWLQEIEGFFASP